MNYQFDAWAEIEKEYRQKLNIINKRIGFVPVYFVREWVKRNGLGKGDESFEELIQYYQPIWSIMRQHIVDTQGEKCKSCGDDVSGKTNRGGIKYSNAEVDHILPVTLGGMEFDVSNLRVLCKRCNTDNRPGLRNQKKISNWIEEVEL